MPPLGVSCTHPHSYVIRRTWIHTFGRWRLLGRRCIVRLRQPPWHEGWIDGPARDPDRVTGNAAHPPRAVRPRRRGRSRAAARPICTTAPPRKDRPPALTPRRNFIRTSIGLPPPSDPMAIRSGADTLPRRRFQLWACRLHDTAATFLGVDTSSVVRRTCRMPMHLQGPAAYLRIIKVRSVGPQGMETTA